MSELDQLYRGIARYRDEIQHIGNKNSGRYRRGSGKNPDSTSGGRSPREQQKKKDDRFTRNIPRDASINAPRPLKPGEKSSAAWYPYAYPKKWSGTQVLKHQMKLEEEDYQRRQKKNGRIESLPHFSGLPGGGASEAQITQAEKEVGVRFAKDFKVMVGKYGAISANGHELCGIHPTDPESYLNTVKATKVERAYWPNTKRDMYAVEHAGIDGIMVWQKTDGTIHQTYPDQPPIKIADSLVEWVNT